MFSPQAPVRSGPQCPECNEALDWPARDLPDEHVLKCPNGHALCSMGDFRLAAREMALQEEFRLTRGSARSHAPQHARKDAERVRRDRSDPEHSELNRKGLPHADFPRPASAERISAA